MPHRIRLSRQIAPKDIPENFAIKNTVDICELANTPHRHTYYMILWPFSSAGRHIVDEHEYGFEPHRIFFVAPGQVHQILQPYPQGLLLLFNPEFLINGGGKHSILDQINLFDPRQTDPISMKSSSIKELMFHANKMIDAYHSTHPLRFETIQAHLQLFLIECNSGKHGKSEFPAEESSEDPAEMSPLTKKFISLVEVHYAEWHQVQDYALRLGISAKHLSEVARKELSQSPKEYIQDRIIMEAKRLMIFSNASLKEIGFDLGFDDPARFSRFFKDYTGIPLQEYRKL